MGLETSALVLSDTRLFEELSLLIFNSRVAPSARALSNGVPDELPPASCVEYQ